MLSSATIASVFGLIVLLAAYEWAGLANLTSVMSRISYVAAILAVLLLVSAIPARWLTSAFPLGLLTIAALWWCLACYWLVDYEGGGSATPTAPAVLQATGLLVLVSAWVALIAIHTQLAQGRYALIVLMFLVWGADIGAFFAGQRWGRMKLAARLSPKKTWEGVAGAFVAGATVMLCGFKALGLNFGAGMLLMTVTVFFSIAGDLYESLLKRQAGVKDSGRLLPGHGGVLDRIDSLLAAAPVFALLLFVSGTSK